MTAGSVLLELASLRGNFDNRRLPQLNTDADFGQRLLELDALDTGGVLHIGQSTHLLALGGLRILTDPWFFDPAFGSLTHQHALPVKPQSVGPLDVIAITHDHPDHADRHALDRLDKNALVLVGVPELLPAMRQLGFSQVEYVPVGKDLSVGALTITATLGVHDVPEQGFVFSVGDQSVYFAGDSATHAGLPQIAERFRLSLAILPIDGTRLRWEPRLVMDPSDAADATALLQPKHVMPSHADAVQSDPLAAHLLTECAHDPHRTFQRLLSQRAPRVTHHDPRPGELFALR